MMDLKKKFRVFFTMSRKANGGFTLVELIVVIAILAILGGVAVPAYSGYVQKAERVADEQLLSAVNKAFDAACIEHGKDVHSVNTAAINLTTDKAVDAINEVDGLDASAVDASFDKYYAGNEGKTFKVIQSLAFDSLLHMFVDPTSVDTLNLMYKGSMVQVSGADVAQILGSTWAEELSAKEVLDMVAGVAGLVETVYGDTYFGAVLGDRDYENAAAAALGIEVSEYTSYRIALLDEMFVQYEAENGKVSNREVDSIMTELGKKLDSNIAVLVAAQNAQAEGANIMSILTQNGGADAKTLIQGNLSPEADSTTGLTQAALAYGLYNSYIYSRTDLTDEEKDAQANNIIGAMNSFDDSGFQTYLTEGQGQKDLDALLASMNVISSQDKGATSSAVKDGLNNDELVSVLQQIMGK